MEVAHSVMNSDWKLLFEAPTYLLSQSSYMANSRLTCQDVDIFEQVFQPKFDDLILDVCCGTGRHLVELARRGYTRLYGYDFSHPLMVAAQTVVRQAELENLISLALGDARSLAFADNSFDVVICQGNSFGVFGSEQEQIQVLAECRRVLKEGGRFWLDVTNGNLLSSTPQWNNWQWLDENTIICRKRTLSPDGTQLTTNELTIDKNRGLLNEQNYTFTIHSAERLLHLLRQAGFKQGRFERELVVEDVPQITGMMKNRLLLTGCK